MEESLQQMCRTCLRSDVALVSAQDKLSTCTFAEMLAKCTTVRITEYDLLPKKVCLSCVIEIKRSYFFKMKCESSQDILQHYVEVQAPTKELAAPKTEQLGSSKKIVSNMEGLTVIQALKIETHNQHKVEYRDLAEILGEEEIRVPENPVEKDNIPMEIIKNEVLDEQRQESEPDHDSEAILQDSCDNDNNMDESGQQQIVTLYCEKCSNTFESMKEFDAHSVDCGKVEMVNRKIVNNILKKCPHCPNYFLNVEKHISKCHSSQKVTETTENDHPSSQESGKEDDCPKSNDEDSFMREITPQDSLSKHEPKSLPAEVYGVDFTCSRCGARFAEARSLHFHKKINKCTTPSFTCKICAKVFAGEKYLIEHLKAHENAFRCLRCESGFSSEKELKEHTKNKHKGVLKNECRLCGKVFTRLSTLKAHFRIHYGATPFVCSICCEECFKAKNLKQHVMFHNHKSYECNHCGSFVSIGELIAHVREHTGDFPFVCNICNKTFQFLDLLDKHKRMHTGELPYACNLCPIRFANPRPLENHRRHHTLTISTLKVHIRNDSEETPFQCSNMCHKNHKLYECNQCSSFVSKEAEYDSDSCNEFPRVSLCECANTEEKREIVKKALTIYQNRDGQDVFKEYCENQTLSNASRNRLVNLVVDNLIFSNASYPTTEEKILWAKATSYLFPNLCVEGNPANYQTFYDPATRGGLFGYRLKTVNRGAVKSCKRQYEAICPKEESYQLVKPLKVYKPARSRQSSAI